MVAGMPLWLKLVFLFAALPAWLFVGFLIVTGRNDSPASLACFVVLLCAALVHIVFDRRPRGPDRGGGIGFGGD